MIEPDKPDGAAFENIVFWCDYSEVDLPPENVSVPIRS